MNAERDLHLFERLKTVAKIFSSRHSAAMEIVTVRLNVYASMSERIIYELCRLTLSRQNVYNKGDITLKPQASTQCCISAGTPSALQQHWPRIKAALDLSRCELSKLFQ